MDIERIQQLEDEIKSYHFNPLKKKENCSMEQTTEDFTNFWNYHVKEVVAHSKRMAKKYNANYEVSWLAAILHDISRLEEKEPHDQISADEAYVLLKKEGFSEELANGVKETIKSHRCEYPIITLEQKILATADAMSHFTAPFYLWIVGNKNYNFTVTLEHLSGLIEGDYTKKIFFEEERVIIQKQYEVLKEWCNK